MSTKAPIYLKRSTRKGKKEKLRDILSSDMISSPLGDFRHTIHIGSGGEDDIFGDISFLKGKFHLLPGKQGSTLSGKAARCVSYELTRAASLHGGQQQQQQQHPSPLLKNAISLPAIGVPGPAAQPAAEAPPKPPRLHLEAETPARGETADPEPPGRTGKAPEPGGTGQPAAQERCCRGDQGGEPRSGRDFAVTGQTEKELLSNAVSLLSLHLDLGPSILEDVLQIMDKEQRVGPSLPALGPSPRCELLSFQ